MSRASGDGAVQRGSCDNPLRLLQEVLLDFTPEHANSHNLFVDIVRFNLMTSDWVSS